MASTHRFALSAVTLGFLAFACGGDGDDPKGGTLGRGGTSTIGVGGASTIGTGGSVGVGGSAASTGSGGSAASGAADGCGSNLTGRVRDFSDTHPDFEGTLGTDKGIVTDMLGSNGKPVYAHGTTGTTTTNGEMAFNQWFEDVAGVNEAEPLTLTFSPGMGGVFTFQDSDFFPIDGRLMGNEGRAHNYHFTFELHTTFVYNGGETFTFRGDDDVFAYINGHLVIDLGGVHTVQEDEVDLDAEARDLGITPGGEYPLDFFFAERHTELSNFRIDTSIVFKDCGDGGEPT